MLFSRKKLFPAGSGMMTWYWPFVVLTIFVTATQFVVVMSEFICRENPPAEAGHATASVFEPAAKMLNIGEPDVCTTKTVHNPPVIE